MNKSKQVNVKLEAEEMEVFRKINEDRFEGVAALATIARYLISLGIKNLEGKNK